MPRVSLIVARIYVGYWGVIAFLGQMYFGEFSFAHTIAGMSGLVLAACGGRSRTRASALAGTVVVAAVLGVLGVLFEALEYYSMQQVPGNDFAWELKAPFLIALLYIGFSSTKWSDRIFGDAHAI